MATVTPAQKLRLGIFVAAALAALGGALAVLLGQTMLQQHDEYVVRFSSRGVSFSGLEAGSAVKYSGINIGQVRSLRVAPDDVGVIEVVLSVARGTPIAEDSRASLASLGITGLKYVDLSRGSSAARIRQPGEEILASDSLIDELSARAGVIAARLDDILLSLQGMLGEESAQNVQRILGESAGILGDNRPQIHEILVNLRALTADLATISRSGVSIASKSDVFMDRLQAVGDSLHSVLSPQGQFVRTMRQTEQLVERLNMLVLRSENDLDVAMRHLRDASANLHDFSMAIRDDPRALLVSPERGDGSASESSRDESRKSGRRR